MKYLKNFNESLSKDELSECLIDLLDREYELIRYNRQIMLNKIIHDSGARPPHTEHEYKCIVRKANFGCDRDLKAWRGDREVELNSFEIESINMAIGASEKIMMSDSSIKEIKVESEYGTIVHPETANAVLTHYIYLSITR